MLEVGQILQNRYQITRHLGLGGMGAVYEAKDMRLGVLVALKQILFELDEGAKAKQQELSRIAFEREAKILANLQHEAFPRVTDYFTEQNRQFLIMELIKGDDLSELLQKRGTPFSPEEVLTWSEQLLEALNYLHNQKPPIIHRDIKPQNLKLTSRGKVVLLDFGIAKDVEPKTQATVTSQSFLAVTLHYSPIEQIFRVMDSTFRNIIEKGHSDKIKRISKQTIDVRSDLYALGATLYHLMTGRLPVDALKRTLEVWTEHPDPLPVPNSVNPEIPPELSDFLLKSMEIESGERFASAKEMRQALRKAVADLEQREDDARKAVYWTEQLQIEKDRQFEEQRRLEIEEEEKRRTNELLRRAEQRANEAERLLLEQDSRNRKVKKSPKNVVVPISPVEFLEYTEEAEKDFEEPENEGNFELLKLEVSPTAKYGKFQAGQADGYSFGTTDSLSELNKAAYLKLLPENDEQETVLRVSNDSQNEENEKPKSGFYQFFSLPVVGVGLLVIIGILAIVFFRSSLQNNSPKQTDSSKIAVPTPEVTISPSITPANEASTPPTTDTNTLPTEITSDKNESQSKPKTTKPEPKATKPSDNQGKTRKNKNLDCIFNDDCK